MRIGFASDHAGFELKERLKAWAQANGHQVLDYGTDGLASVDYPDFAHRAAEKLHEWERLVLVCGSGIGISIAANRHVGVRCALVTSPEHAALARQHNDANAIAFGQRLTDPLMAESYLKIFWKPHLKGEDIKKELRRSKFRGRYTLASDFLAKPLRPLTSATRAPTMAVFLTRTKELLLPLPITGRRDGWCSAECRRRFGSY